MSAMEAPASLGDQPGRARAGTPPALVISDLGDALPPTAPPPQPPGPAIIRSALDTLAAGDHSPCLLVDYMLAMNRVPTSGSPEWSPEDLRALHLVRVAIQAVLARLQPRGDRARISLDAAVGAQNATMRERGISATPSGDGEPLTEVTLLFLREHAMTVETAAALTDNPHQHQPAIGTIQSLLQRVQPLHWGVYTQYQRSLLRYSGALHRYRTVYPPAGHMQKRALCQAAAIGLAMLDRYSTLADKAPAGLLGGAPSVNLLTRYGLVLPAFSTGSSSAESPLSFRAALEGVGLPPTAYPPFATCPDTPAPGSSVPGPRWAEFDVIPAPLVVPHVQATLVGKTLWALLSIGGCLGDVRAAGHKVLAFIAAVTQAPLPTLSEADSEDRSTEPLWELCLSLLLAARDTAPDPVAAGDATLDLHDATIQYISVHCDCPLPNAAAAAGASASSPATPPSTASGSVGGSGPCVRAALLAKQLTASSARASSFNSCSGPLAPFSMTSFTTMSSLSSSLSRPPAPASSSSPSPDAGARAWSYELPSPAGTRTPASVSAPPSPPTSQGRALLSSSNGSGSVGTPAATEAAGSPVSVRSYTWQPEGKQPVLEIIAEGDSGRSDDTAMAPPDALTGAGVAGGAGFGSPVGAMRTVSTSSVGSFSIAPARGGVSSVGSSSRSVTGGGAGSSASSSSGGKVRSPAALVRQFYPICASSPAPASSLSGRGSSGTAPVSVAPTPLLVGMSAVPDRLPGAGLSSSLGSGGSVTIAPFPAFAASPALSAVLPLPGAAGSGGRLSLRLNGGASASPAFLLPPPAATVVPGGVGVHGIAAGAGPRRFRAGSACSTTSAMCDDETASRISDSGGAVMPPLAAGEGAPLTPQAAVANATALRMLQLLDNTAVALELSLLALGVNILPRSSGSRGAPSSNSGLAPSPLSTGRSGQLSASPLITGRSATFAAPFPSPPASPAISPAALAPSPVPFASVTAEEEEVTRVGCVRPAHVPPLTRLCFRDFQLPQQGSDAMSDGDASPSLRQGARCGLVPYDDDPGSGRSRDDAMSAVEGIDEEALGVPDAEETAEGHADLVFVDSALEELAGVESGLNAMALSGSTPPRPLANGANDGAASMQDDGDVQMAPPSAGRKRRGSGDEYDAYACEEMLDNEEENESCGGGGAAGADASGSTGSPASSGTSPASASGGNLRGRPRADTPPGPRPRKRSRTLSPDKFDSPASLNNSTSSEDSGGSDMHPSPASAGVLPLLPASVLSPAAAVAHTSSTTTSSPGTPSGGPSPRLLMPSPTSPALGSARNASPSPGPRLSAAAPASPVGSPGRPSAFRSRSASLTAPLPSPATSGGAGDVGFSLSAAAAAAAAPAAAPGPAVPLPVVSGLPALPFSFVPLTGGAAAATAQAPASDTGSPALAPIHRQRRPPRDAGSSRGVRWSPAVLAVEDARRRVRAVSMDELPFSPDGTVHPSALVVLEDGRLGIPITERVAAMSDPHNILLSLPSVRGMAVPAVSVSSTPVLPAGPIPSSGGSASAAPGAWPLAIPSMRCIPSHPQPHCPLSPAFGFRLWELRAAALPVGSGVLRCLPDLPPDSPPTAPPSPPQTLALPAFGSGGEATSGGSAIPLALPAAVSGGSTGGAFGGHRCSLSLYRQGQAAAAASDAAAALQSAHAAASAAAAAAAAGSLSPHFTFLKLQALPVPEAVGSSGGSLEASPLVPAFAATAAAGPSASPLSMPPAASPLGSAGSGPSSSPPSSLAPSPTASSRLSSLIDNEEYRDALVLALKRAYKAVLGEVTSLVERFPAALAYYHSATAAAAAAAAAEQL